MDPIGYRYVLFFVGLSETEDTQIIQERLLLIGKHIGLGIRKVPSIFQKPKPPMSGHVCPKSPGCIYIYIYIYIIYIYYNIYI